MRCAIGDVEVEYESTWYMSDVAAASRASHCATRALRGACSDSIASPYEEWTIWRGKEGTCQRSGRTASGTPRAHLQRIDHLCQLPFPLSQSPRRHPQIDIHLQSFPVPRAKKPSQHLATPSSSLRKKTHLDNRWNGSGLSSTIPIECLLLRCGLDTGTLPAAAAGSHSSCTMMGLPVGVTLLYASLADRRHEETFDRRGGGGPSPTDMEEERWAYAGRRGERRTLKSERSELSAAERREATALRGLRVGAGAVKGDT